MYGSTTPGGSHGGRTPMYGSQTPMYGESGSRTPHYGSQVNYNIKEGLLGQQWNERYVEARRLIET